MWLSGFKCSLITRLIASQPSEAKTLFDCRDEAGETPWSLFIRSGVSTLAVAGPTLTYLIKSWQTAYYMIYAAFIPTQVMSVTGVNAASGATLYATGVLQVAYG